MFTMAADSGADPTKAIGEAPSDLSVKSLNYLKMVL